jgi:hypothetical protein
MHCKVDGKNTPERNISMFSSQVLCYNSHHYGHLAKDYTKVWRRNSEEKRKENQRNKEKEYPVNEVDQIHEVDIVKEERKEHEHPAITHDFWLGCIN